MVVDIETRNESIKAFLLLGNLYLSTKDYQEALFRYERIFRLFSEDEIKKELEKPKKDLEFLRLISEAHMGLYNAYLGISNEYQRAQENYKKAQELEGIIMQEI
jgi:tetratricopeptide (TPR) repeat protein